MGHELSAEVDAFHDHLDVCERCRKDVFNLCPVGAPLLKAVGEAATVDLGAPSEDGEP